MSRVIVILVNLYFVGTGINKNYQISISLQKHQDSRLTTHDSGLKLSVTWEAGEGDDVADVCHAGYEEDEPFET